MALIRKSAFDKLFKGVKKSFNKFATKFNYDFDKEMRNNEIAQSSNPRLSAVKWMRDDYSKNPDNQYKRRIMRQGLMYIYKYDAKTKDTLDYWDRTPMIICLGTFKTKSGKLREIGVNLHMLPQKVRILVLFQMFYMFKSRYKSNLHADKQKEVPIDYNIIKKTLDKYGIGFAIRTYIPNRRTNVIEVQQEDWNKAVYYNPFTYEGISAKKLESEWRNYVKTNRLGAVKNESFRN